MLLVALVITELDTEAEDGIGAQEPGDALNATPKTTAGVNVEYPWDDEEGLADEEDEGPADEEEDGPADEDGAE